MLMLTIVILSQDIKDSEVYAHLLVAVCPDDNAKGPIGLEPLNVSYICNYFTLKQRYILDLNGETCQVKVNSIQ